METNFIPLESIQIATPCRADWDQMKGDEQVRFCGSCAKNVYNFSTMTRAEAERLMLEKEGNLCVRLYRRADGTVITGDCAVGIAPVFRTSRFFGALVAIIAAVLGNFGMTGVGAAPAKGAKPVPRLSKKEIRGQISAIKAKAKSNQRSPQSDLTALLEMEQGQLLCVKVSPTAKPVKIPTKAHGNRLTGKLAKPDLRQHR